MRRYLKELHRSFRKGAAWWLIFKFYFRVSWSYNSKFEVYNIFHDWSPPLYFRVNLSVEVDLVCFLPRKKLEKRVILWSFIWVYSTLCLRIWIQEVKESLSVIWLAKELYMAASYVISFSHDARCFFFFHFLFFRGGKFLKLKVDKICALEGLWTESGDWFMALLLLLCNSCS